MKFDIKQLIILVLVLGLGIFLGTRLASSKPLEHTSTHNHETTSGNATAEVWTCSMHPQIRQPESGLCPLCAMDLIPASSMPSSDDPLVLTMTKDALRLAQVATTTIGTSSIQSEGRLQLAGKIQADERRAASQVTHVAGRIEQLKVSFTGEYVRQGQVIANIYAPDLITAQRELLEAKQLETVNPQLLPAARQKLRYWRLSEQDIQSIETSGEIRETFPVYAQQSGVVTERMVAVSDHVREGSVLLKTINLETVWGIFDAFEEDLTTIKVGDQITFTTPAVPNESFTAKVTFIDPLLNPQTRTAAVRVEIANRGGLLKPEMLLIGTLEGDSAASAKLMVPQSAVLWTGKRSVVYVQLADQEVPSFQYREVALGERQGDSYIVNKGLRNGDIVVTNGAFVIDAAAQLNNQASMMNGEVAAKAGAEAHLLPDYSNAISAEAGENFATLITRYITIKDALIGDDVSLANLAVMGMPANIKPIEASLPAGEIRDFWTTLAEPLTEHVALFEKANNVEAQRQQFQYISNLMIKMVKVFGAPDSNLYLQYCPMAFDDQGADWLSEEEEVLNPYFGDAMLRCGVVKETF